MNEIGENGTLEKHDVVRGALMFEMIVSEKQPIYAAYHKDWFFARFRMRK